MNSLKCSDLIAKYPHLYGDPDPEGTCKHYMQLGGFETSEGWYDLLERLSQKVSDYIKENPIEGFYVQQVKSKFAGLRYYYNGFDEGLNKLIDEAEKEASNTCERCGSQEDVKPRKHGSWLYGWCKSCFDRIEEIRAEQWAKSKKESDERRKKREEEKNGKS